MNPWIRETNPFFYWSLIRIPHPYKNNLRAPQGTSHFVEKNVENNVEKNVETNVENNVKNNVEKNVENNVEKTLNCYFSYK